MTHVCLGLLRKSEQQTVLRSEQSGLGWNERERKGERDILRERERKRRCFMISNVLATQRTIFVSNDVSLRSLIFYFYLLLSISCATNGTYKSRASLLSSLPDQ